MKKLTSLAAVMLLLTSSATAFCSSAVAPKGDLNSDGLLNGADLAILSDYILGKNVELDVDSADLNKDGVIDCYDLTIMRQQIVENEDSPENFYGIVDQFFSGYTNALVKVGGGSIETNDASCVARSVEEMDRYLNVFYDDPEDSIIRHFNKKYDDEFFADNVLIMNSLFQSSGSTQSLEIHSVDYEDGMINVSVHPTDYANTDDVESALLFHIVIPKEQFLDMPVKWKLIERDDPVDPPANPDFYGIVDQFFSGYNDDLVKSASGSIETNDTYCIARSVKEMNRYLNYYYDESVISELNERYDDEFFKNSVLIMNSLYQPFGSTQSIQISSVNYENEMLNVSMRPTDYADTEDVSSALLIHIVMSKEHFFKRPLKWTLLDPAPVEPPQTNQKIISVNNIMQNPELPTGCEVTSLAILLHHYGFNIDKVALSRNFLPKLDFYWSNGVYYGADFRTTFAGNPESQYSYGCYAPCIVTTANKYFSNIGAGCWAYDATGADFDSLLTDYIDKDNPVCIWITSSNLHESSLTSIWTTPAGETVQWRAYEHCVVLTGYDKDKNTIYVSDPLVGNTSYNYDLIKQRYNELGKQAVYIQ